MKTSTKIEVDEKSGQVRSLHGVDLPPNSLAVITPFASSLTDRIFSEQEIQTVDDAFAWGERTRSKR